MRVWLVLAAMLAIGDAGLVTAARAGAQDTAPDPAARHDRDRVDDDEWRAPMRMLRQLDVFGGPEVRIGVTIRDVETNTAASSGGAEVTGVSDDSPASRAGIKTGDVIVEFDGERVRSARQLSRVVGEAAPGRSVQAVVVRDGRRVTVSVTPEPGRHDPRDEPGHGPDTFMRPPAAPFDRGWTLPPGPPGTFEWQTPSPRTGRLGITVQEATPQLAEFFGGQRGVLVTSVRAGSPAARAGLKAGDLITGINGVDVARPADLMREVSRAQDGAELTLTYLRDKKPATATARLETRDDDEGPSRPI